MKLHPSPKETAIGGFFGCLATKGYLPCCLDKLYLSVEGVFAVLYYSHLITFHHHLFAESLLTGQSSVEFDLIPENYHDNLPPSTPIVEPVINLDASLNKNATAFATSSTFPNPRYCLSITISASREPFDTFKKF
jgi:hypothetical protein